MTAVFYGVSPAVIALILHSCYRLAKLRMEDWLQWAIAAVCLVVTLFLGVYPPPMIKQVIASSQAVAAHAAISHAATR